MSVKNNVNLEFVLPPADRGQTTVGGRGEKEKKGDGEKRRGELACKRMDVRGRQSERDEVAKMLRRRGREMWASHGALLQRERESDADREERKRQNGKQSSER